MSTDPFDEDFEEQKDIKQRKRTAIQTRRLENAALVLEEATNLKVDGERQFNMEKFVHFCGAPACVLGYYGSRTDLQKLMVISGTKTKVKGRFGEYRLDAQLVYRKGLYEQDIVDYYDERLLDHFGLNAEQSYELFGSEGCGGANTPLQAARYIRKFIKKNPTY